MLQFVHLLSSATFLASCHYRISSRHSHWCAFRGTVQLSFIPSLCNFAFLSCLPRHSTNNSCSKWNLIKSVSVWCKCLCTKVMKNFCFSVNLIFYGSGLVVYLSFMGLATKWKDTIDAWQRTEWLIALESGGCKMQNLRRKAKLILIVVNVISIGKRSF